MAKIPAWKEYSMFPGISEAVQAAGTPLRSHFDGAGAMTID
jgi:hypothetical protein